MKNFIKSTCVVVLLAVGGVFAVPLISAGMARAGVVDIETVYRRKAWEVSFVAFDDGTFSCMAEVGSSSNRFAIWAYADESARLQFYNTDWEFDDETADVIIKVDRRAEWTLNDADLHGNSVLFDLPDEDSSYRFLREVMRGNVLNLYSSAGSLIERYSLAGSSASIVKLIECGDALNSQDDDDNPFN